MRRAGQILALVGLVVGIFTGLSLLLPAGAFGLSWLMGVALVKLTFVASLALIGGGAVMQQIGRRADDHAKMIATGPGTLWIRRAKVEDAAVVAAFMARSFTETFGPDNKPEDIAAHVKKSYGVPQQSAELGSQDYVTIVMEGGAAIAALAQLRRHAAPPSVKGESPVELHRFYVDRPWQGRGVAKLLMGEAMLGAKALGARTVWLGVWERNARAIRFYEKCGYKMAGTQDFFVGSDQQYDRVMTIDC